MRREGRRKGREGWENKEKEKKEEEKKDEDKKEKK